MLGAKNDVISVPYGKLKIYTSKTLKSNWELDRSVKFEFLIISKNIYIDRNIHQNLKIKYQKYE